MTVWNPFTSVLDSFESVKVPCHAAATFTLGPVSRDELLDYPEPMT